MKKQALVVELHKTFLGVEYNNMQYYVLLLSLKQVFFVFVLYKSHILCYSTNVCKQSEKKKDIFPQHVQIKKKTN